MARLLTFFALMISPALAQKTPAKTPSPQIMIFNAENVNGDVHNPNGQFVAVRVRPKLDSLIEVRGSFLPELLQSAENL